MRVPGLSLDADHPDLDWRATREPGVFWIPLFLEAESGGRRREESEGGDAAVLIRMEPGHGYPAHRHVGVEEVLVLSGGYRDELGDHVQGDFVRYPAGSVHAPVALGDRGAAAGPSNPACVLYAIAREGVELVDGP